MKRMAGMQPYFFPYLGYWQLIDAVDCFVLFDDAQYIKQGWVNRNRILKPEGGWQYIHVPVARHPLNTPIRDVKVASDSGWEQRLRNRLNHYRTTAPFYDETLQVINQCLSETKLTIGALNAQIVRTICQALSIETQIIVASEVGFDYRDVSEPGDWAVAHARQLGATELVNPINGLFLQNTEKLARHNIGISAIFPPEVAYSQSPRNGCAFESGLSIIDVLMFKGCTGARSLLQQRTIRRVQYPESAKSDIFSGQK